MATKDTKNHAGLRLRTIGVLRSRLKQRDRAPKQGSEAAPDAWLEVDAWASPALEGLCAGDEVFVITWLHEAQRDTLRVHPRDDPRNPMAGVFATRSADRPNPLGLHPVTVRKIAGRRLRIGPIEAIDGTPVVDVKPVLRADRAEHLDEAGASLLSSPRRASRVRPGRALRRPSR